MNAHEPPGARLALAPSQVAALDHIAELRESAEHARVAALARAARTDHPVDTSATFSELLTSAAAVLRAARNTAIASLRRPAGRRVQAVGRRERVTLDSNQACATC